MVLERTNACIQDALQEEVARLEQTRYIYQEVGATLDEMVYDVEVCEYERQVASLKQELSSTNNELQQKDARVDELLQTQEKAFQYASKVEQEGKEMADRLQQSLSTVVSELSHKQNVEEELAQANERLAMTSRLSRELAQAQREIRELHRQNSIRQLLKGQTSSLRKYRKTSRTDDSSYMETSDTDAKSVYAMSMSNRPMMVRIHVLFGTIPKPRRKNEVASKPSSVRPKPSPPSSTNSSSWTQWKSPKFLSSENQKSQKSKLDQMIKRLSADDIKVFHDLSKRLKSVETQLTVLQAEKQDVMERLQGTENVRDFLMDKVSELEDALSNATDESAKKEEQVTMDREIIGFLDAKVQEYEHTLAETMREKETAESQVEKIKKDTAAKQIIVEDMARLLADEKQSLQVQLRTQRKVLVKEVKSLRYQNQKLEQENDRYRQQMDQLHRVLHQFRS